jgi:hypothetical protein
MELMHEGAFQDIKRSLRTSIFLFSFLDEIFIGGLLLLWGMLRKIDVL